MEAAIARISQKSSIFTETLDEFHLLLLQCHHAHYDGRGHDVAFQDGTNRTGARSGIFGSRN